MTSGACSWLANNDSRTTSSKCLLPRGGQSSRTSRRTVSTLENTDSLLPLAVACSREAVGFPGAGVLAWCRLVPQVSLPAVPSPFAGGHVRHVSNLCGCEELSPP